jgi:XRE family transcriptional regulator, fatty acid utilization regulator
MSEDKLFAGPAIRRVRRGAGLTQTAMANALGISPSYFNLIERGQRPLSAMLVVRLAERFGFDPASLAHDDRVGGVAAMRRRLADPRFADLGIDAGEIEEWLSSAPGLATAFARLYDLEDHGPVSAEDDEPPVLKSVRREIERWSNHFADLDARAEALADELRLAHPEVYVAIGDRLRSRHQLAIRILPVDVMPDRLRRVDLHARQLQLSEMLRPASRTFEAAVLLAQVELRDEIDALAAGAALSDRAATRLFRRHLAGYAAAAMIMPYQRFLRACEATGYDFAILERRFSAGFEQVAHRLTTLQRVGARGLPFFMLRIDRAGQVSKRYAGSSASPLVESHGRCPLWNVHAAFARPGEMLADRLELEDGSRWLSFARSIEGPARDVDGRRARFAVVVGVEERMASALNFAHSALDRLAPIGLGCTRCLRVGCVQRSAPPKGRPLAVNERERGTSAFSFTDG